MDLTQLRLCTKICLFALSLVLLLLPASISIHRFKQIHEPRRALLNGVGVEGYSVALVGDSAFCSFYVDNEGDTIWKKFEQLTGTACFPGALNGAKGGDFIDAASYMAARMSPASIVFIDLVPTRLMWNEAGRGRNYHLDEVLKEGVPILHKCFNYMAVDYLKYGLLCLRSDRYDSDRQGGYSRVWNRDGDFARVRYEMMLAWSCWSASSTVRQKAGKNIHYLREIGGVFRSRKVRVVFVLTPLNKQQIYTYSSKLVADQVYSLLDEMREMTKAYLSGIGASYIDLFDACPTAGFADVIHTNACGDEVIARALAAYVGRAQP